jgi:hypothetical protein
MPKLSCLCGEYIPLHALPHPRGGVLLPEAAWDALIEDVDAQMGAAEAMPMPERMRLFGANNRAKRHVYVCPRCGRLHLFRHPSDTTQAAIWTLERGDANSAIETETDSG